MVSAMQLFTLSSSKVSQAKNRININLSSLIPLDLSFWGPTFISMCFHVNLTPSITLLCKVSGQHQSRAKLSQCLFWGIFCPKEFDKLFNFLCTFVMSIQKVDKAIVHNFNSILNFTHQCYPCNYCTVCKIFQIGSKIDQILTKRPAYAFILI